jgi:transposase
MRGNETPSGSLFSYVNLESRIPATHPLRPIKVMVDNAMKALDKDFDRMYSSEGRPGIPPERLLRALLLQVLYSVRSERQLMEQLDYNLLFRWFVGLGVDDPVWVPETFTQNRDRLRESHIASRFFDEILNQARQAGLISKEHFTVDGTFIEAWASHKSFRRKDDKDDSPGPGRECRSGLQGREAEQQDSRIEDRSGRPADVQGQRGGEARTSRPCADGKPARLGGGDGSDGGHRDLRDGGGFPPVGETRGDGTWNRRRGQGL